MGKHKRQDCQSLKSQGEDARYPSHFILVVFHSKSAAIKRRSDNLQPRPCGMSISIGLDVQCVLLPYASLVPRSSNVGGCTVFPPLIDLCPPGLACITVGCQHIH